MKRFIDMRQPWRNYLLRCHASSYVFILYIGHTYIDGNSASGSKRSVATVRKDPTTITSCLSLGLTCWTLSTLRIWFGSNLLVGMISGWWCLKLVFGVIVLSFVIVCVGYILPIRARGTYEYLICSYNARGVSAAAFSLGYCWKHHAVSGT